MTLSARSILCFPHKQETRNEVNSCLKGASSAECKTVCKEPPTYRGKHPNISHWVRGFTEGECCSSNALKEGRRDPFAPMSSLKPQSLM